METQTKKPDVLELLVTLSLPKILDILESLFKHYSNSDNKEKVKSYVESLDEETKQFVMHKMISKHLNVLYTNTECSNTCSGQGSTPYGHWEHDSRCNCVWVPEFGG